MQGCTIVAANYLAQARVLARTFLVHHPGARFAILLVDDLTHERRTSDGIELLGLRDIGLDGEEFRMPVIYDVTELSTAVKPWLLRFMQHSGTPETIYFDPDIEIFTPLHDIVELAAQHSIVLVPHVTEPLPQDGLRPTESDILGAGIYNLGFIAIGAGSEAFLHWWSARLKREAIIDPPRMRFTDQRWVDFVPGLFRHHILRDRGCDVAYWNLHSRSLAWTGTRYEVDGEPLRFFHFSGYNPDMPDVLSRFQEDRPRVTLAANPAVAKICAEYREKLHREGFAETSRAAYGFDEVVSGVRIDLAMRRVYRRALEAFDFGKGLEPPSPFDPATADRFLAWLNEPVNPRHPIITRYMLGIHAAQPELQHEFPDPLGYDAYRFHCWFSARQRDHARWHVLPPLLEGLDPTTRESLEHGLTGVSQADRVAAALAISERHNRGLELHLRRLDDEQRSLTQEISHAADALIGEAIGEAPVVQDICARRRAGRWSGKLPAAVSDELGAQAKNACRTLTSAATAKERARALAQLLRLHRAARDRGGSHTLPRTEVPGPSSVSGQPVPLPSFDAAWYLGQYVDVRDSGTDPWEHYVRWGAAEGRNPNAVFQTRWYTAVNRDARDSGMNPLEHFERVGAPAGRKPAPLFDPRWYGAAANLGPYTAGSEALRHYLLQHGAEQLCDPHPLFEAVWYGEQNPEILGLNPLEHYVSWGGWHMRTPQPLFDPYWYLSQLLPDGATALTPLEHYVEIGGENGLDPHPLFNTAWYSAQLQESRTGNITPLEHYIRSGAANGIDPHPFFQTSYYLSVCPDQAVARRNPLRHYVTVGARRRLSPHPAFDPEFYITQDPALAGKPDLLVHYLTSGWLLGYKPNADFDGGTYATSAAEPIVRDVEPLTRIALARLARSA